MLLWHLLLQHLLWHLLLQHPLLQHFLLNPMLPMVVLLNFSWPPSVVVVLGGRSTSLATYFQTFEGKMKWISTPSRITTYLITTSIITTYVVTKFTLMVTVLVVSIVAVVITSTFTTISTFSIVMIVRTSNVTTISTYLILTCCYGIWFYNICFSIALAYIYSSQFVFLILRVVSLYTFLEWRSEPNNQCEELRGI